MKTRNGIVAALSVITGTTLMVPSPASAAPATRGDIACTGAVTGGTVRNVTVGGGAKCTLDHVLVTGSVTVEPLGSVAVTRAVVHGNVTANGDPYEYTGPATASVDHSVVTGDITLNNSGTLTVNRSTARNIAGHGNFYGVSLDLKNSAVTQNVNLTGFPYSGLMMSGMAVRGTVGASGLSATISKSYIRGATTLGTDNVSVCGSRLSDLKASPEYVEYLGDTGSCGGNTIRGSLDVGAPDYGFSAYNNVVHGRAVSPDQEPRFADNGVSGSGNRFLGGVTGYLAKLT